MVQIYEASIKTYRHRDIGVTKRFLFIASFESFKNSNGFLAINNFRKSWNVFRLYSNKSKAIIPANMYDNMKISIMISAVIGDDNNELIM